MASAESSQAPEAAAASSDAVVTQADAAEMGGSIFSIKRPKDIREGLGQGVANIAKGAVGGAAILVGAPIQVRFICGAVASH